MTGLEQAGAAILAAGWAPILALALYRAYLTIDHRRPCRHCMWRASIPGTAYCGHHISKETPK